MLKPVLAATLTLALAAGAPAVTLHVSPAPLPDIPAAQQHRTVQAAVDAAGPGDVVRIQSGVYREAVVIETGGTEQQPLTLEAAPGQRVELCRADRLTGWSLDPDAPEGEHVHLAPLATLPPTAGKTQPDDDHHRALARPEMLTFAGMPLRQVLDRAHVTRGAYHVDVETKQLTFQTRANDKLFNDDGEPFTHDTVEFSVRDVVLDIRASYVVVRGLTVRLAASAGQQGAADVTGGHVTLKDCTFEDNHAVGLHFRGPNIVARRCVFRRNGHFGFTATLAHDNLLTESTVRDNGWKGWRLGWGAGGNKISWCRNFVVDRCVVTGNRGNGVWFDIDDRDGVVRHCFIADNQACGIFYEIASGLHAHDNVIVRNGLRADFTAWGARAGISISSSPGARIERNLIVGNREGVTFREQIRTTSRIEERGAGHPWIEYPTWNRDHVVTRNVIAHNQDNQIGGWFAQGGDDARHFPREKDAPPAVIPDPDARFTYPLDAEPPAQPSHLALEDLSLTIRDNLYAPPPTGKPLVQWGAAWEERSRTYPDLNAFREDLGFGEGSRTADPGFANPTANDFRVEANSPALKLDAYPEGEVPGVKLGVRP